MSLSTQDSDEDSQYVLVAKMDNARNVTTILKAIHFKDVRSSTTRSWYYELTAWVSLYRRDSRST